MGAPYTRLGESLRSRGPTLNLLFEEARFSLERDGDGVIRDAFAGTIVLVLHDMLAGYWRESGGSRAQWKRATPSFGGYSFPQVLAAALDNYRHFADWDAQKPATLAQMRSVRVLAGVLDIPVKKAAKRPAFRGNVCWAVLERLTDRGGYTRLDALVRESAQTLASEEFNPQLSPA